MNTPEVAFELPKLTEDDDPVQVLRIVAREMKPQVPDHHEERYGVSLVFPINVARRSPYNKFGEFGPVLNYLPPRALIPFFTLDIDIPAEQQGGIIEGDSASELISALSGQFDLNRYEERLEKSAFRMMRRSAKQCADIFLQDYGANEGPVFGCDVFPTLQKLNYEEGLAIYATVLPVHDEKIFGVRQRIVNGYTVEGPFVDNIREFLRTQGGSTAAVERSELSAPMKLKAHELREQLLSLADETYRRCQSVMADKNNRIRQGLVAGYDQPNYRQHDAPQPPDLLIMAHGNIPPIAEEEMRRAEIFADAATAKANSGNAAPAPRAEGLYTLEEAQAKLLSDTSFLDALASKLNGGGPGAAPEKAADAFESIT